MEVSLGQGITILRTLPRKASSFATCSSILSRLRCSLFLDQYQCLQLRTCASDFNMGLTQVLYIQRYTCCRSQTVALKPKASIKVDFSLYFFHNLRNTFCSQTCQSFGLLFRLGVGIPQETPEVDSHYLTFCNVNFHSVSEHPTYHK